MSGTGVVRSGGDVVNTVTGEVVGSVGGPTFSMVDYLASVSSPASIKAQKELAAAYDKACDSLIGDNDVQKEGGRTFKKKSAWRKLARHFTISTEVAKVEREFYGDGQFLALVTVRAIGPWGQSAEAVGACATDEATGRRTITIADAIATAETRATNRATSNLIAMGEVSAEEMSKGSGGSPRGGNAGNGSSTAKPPEEMKMPIGDSKGQLLGAIDSKDLASAAKWCRDKGKFLDLADACARVIANRESGAASPDDEGGSHDGYGLNADDSDDLPF